MNCQKFFIDTALLVRFHGFIEGWKLPTMQEDLIFSGHTLNIEYFSEILSMLRLKPEYGEIVKNLLVVPMMLIHVIKKQLLDWLLHI